MQTLDIHNTPYSEFNAFRLFSHSNQIESERNSALIEQLQTSLDLGKLLNIFAMEAAKHIDFAGLYFKNDTTNDSARGSRKGKIERHFELKLNGEILGKLSYSLNSSINLNSVNILDELHKFLLFPLRNALQFKHALSLAMQDSLTGLGNRRYFDEQLKRAMHHAKRNHHQLGLIVSDLNKFKAINDTFGHHIGDEVLVQFANALKSSVRDSDSLFRFGGDEFVIIVEDACQQSLVAIEKRIHIALKNNLLLTKHKVSCSLGFTFMNRADNENSLFQRADKSLYHHKMNMQHKNLA